ncbi:unnamed protein product [Didymodactylos carnosus]|uniref:Uncharacterized protein n=1 Tax=Didymodactylos carnosus TaxID=1234261 RepID=A0A8S2DPQ8_9BILA|nr:unnamed protein product [Didymodactylos carnosus]CAF3719075.1 unnamed protein product [Didymodactylos carnosus]
MNADKRSQIDDDEQRLDVERNCLSKTSSGKPCPPTNPCDHYTLKHATTSNNCEKFNGSHDEQECTNQTKFSLNNNPSLRSLEIVLNITSTKYADMKQIVLQQKKDSFGSHHISLTVPRVKNDELMHRFIAVTTVTEPIDGHYYLSPYLINCVDSKANGKNPIYVPTVENEHDYSTQMLRIKYNKELIPQKYQKLINQERSVPVILYVCVMVKVNEEFYFHPKKMFAGDSSENEIDCVNPTKIKLTKENVSNGIVELKLVIVNSSISDKTKKPFLSLYKFFTHTTVHECHPGYNIDDEKFRVFKLNEPISKNDLHDYYLGCIISYNDNIDRETLCISSKMTKPVKENENRLFQLYQLDRLHLAFTICTREENNISNYRHHPETTMISDTIIYQENFHLEIDNTQISTTDQLMDKCMLNPVQILIQPATIQRPRTYMEQLKSPHYIQGCNENTKPTTEINPSWLHLLMDVSLVFSNKDEQRVYQLRPASSDERNKLVILNNNTGSLLFNITEADIHMKSKSYVTYHTMRFNFAFSYV